MLEEYNMYKEIDSNKRKTILLIILFLIFVMGLGYLLSWYFNNPLILIIAGIIAFIQAWASYYYSDSISLAVAGAKEAPRENYLELHRIVENLAITAGLPKPKVYIIADPSPNAFATGRDPKHASIAVTSGLLDMMNKNELQGVIAHELSHVGNYDIRVMTIVVVLVGIVTLASDFFLRYLWWGGGRRERNDEGGQIQLILFVLAIAFAILAPLFATLIQLAISRKREFLADASGALLTRYPEGLASALEKIENSGQPLIHANRATAHLYISDPFKGKISNLFATHPPIEERIKRLDAMIGK